MVKWSLQVVVLVHTMHGIYCLLKDSKWPKCFRLSLPKQFLTLLAFIFLWRVASKVFKQSHTPKSGRGKVAKPRLSKFGITLFQEKQHSPKQNRPELSALLDSTVVICTSSLFCSQMLTSKSCHVLATWRHNLVWYFYIHENKCIPYLMYVYSLNEHIRPS